MHRITYYQAKDFARRLSLKENRRYRLPTEVEWEMACKAGSNQIYSGSDQDSAIADYAYFKAIAYDKKPIEVGSKKANGFGLYDLSGNVYEWVEPTASYQGLAGYHTIKGGSWLSSANSLRCAHRAFVVDGDFELDTGFRLVISEKK